MVYDPELTIEMVRVTFYIIDSTKTVSFQVRVVKLLLELPGKKRIGYLCNTVRNQSTFGGYCQALKEAKLEYENLSERLLVNKVFQYNRDHITLFRIESK